jgi:hypothetical protein
MEDDSLTIQSPPGLGAFGTALEGTGAVRVASLFKPESDVDQSFIMTRFQIQGFAIKSNGLWIIICVLYQPKEIIGLGGRSFLCEIGFAYGDRFLQSPGVSELACDFEG